GGPPPIGLDRLPPCRRESWCATCPSPSRPGIRRRRAAIWPPLLPTLDVRARRVCYTSSGISVGWLGVASRPCKKNTTCVWTVQVIYAQFLSSVAAHPFERRSPGPGAVRPAEVAGHVM